MSYFIIQRAGKNDAVIGMSRMSMPSPGMHGPCKLNVRVNKEARTFTIARNPNVGFPVQWVDIYNGREITKVEFENYLEIELFTNLKDDWFNRFLKRYMRSGK